MLRMTKDGGLIGQVSSISSGSFGGGAVVIIKFFPRLKASLRAEGCFFISPRASTLLTNKLAE